MNKEDFLSKYGHITKQKLILVSVVVREDNKNECSLNCDFLSMEDINDNPYFLCCLFDTDIGSVEESPIRCKICIDEFGV